MKWKRPTSLGKTIEAKAVNRPIKIAYLVPFADEEQTNLILDAVFFESYTRWAGLYTLIVPTSPEAFMSDEFDHWLMNYDPDFIYSYVDLDDEFVKSIDRNCCPVAFLKHERRERNDSKREWRSYLPEWTHYLQAVPSISTAQSPSSYTQFHEERGREPTIFIQYGMSTPNRFLADNFGVGFSVYQSSNAVPGYFRTLCLVPEGLGENISVGTERCHTVLEAFRAISDRRSVPVARLAMVNSTGVSRTESLVWAYAFRLIIGDAAADRINFWNARHLGNGWSDSPNALILSPSFFEDSELVIQLGQYLNKNNFLGRGNGPYQVEIHSASVSNDVLSEIKDKLQPHTWNSVHVSKEFNATAVPNKKDLEQRSHSISHDAITLKLTEDINEVVATEPAHFMFVPPQLKGIAKGQWMVELTIQRHNNISQHSNVIDYWTLPRRSKIVRAFTDSLAKPTLAGNLALLPSTGSFPMRRQAINDPSGYEITLPSDETFFRHLALEFYKLPADDLRAGILISAYQDLATSDKGRNLRGVISMFDDLSMAYEMLTNKFWRTVLAEAKEDATRPLSFDRNRLNGLAPNDKATIKRFREELNFTSDATTRKYLTAGLTDALERLIRLKVFYQVAQWRCNYCGHMNSRSFDRMKIKNQCDICSTEYFAPVDIEWQYELNDFVYRSLQKHTGMPVLWTLGYLQRRLHNGAFWYLPEVDLYEGDEFPERKNEIDILCMLDGKFYAVEVKRSVSMFLNKPNAVDKFVSIIKLLRPDVALLSFERYAAGEGDQVEATKIALAKAAEMIRKQISPWSKLEILIAQNVADFNEVDSEFGWHGIRLQRFNDYRS